VEQTHIVDRLVEVAQAMKALSIYTKLIQSVCLA